MDFLKEFVLQDVYLIELGKAYPKQSSIRTDMKLGGFG